MSRNYYRSGDNNLICDVCGRKVKASETRKRWDGFQVCSDDWEERHPQDFVRARADKISVPVVRPIAPTPFNIPMGIFEQLKLQETISFFIYSTVFSIEDLKLQETGGVCFLDYVDPTYFAEVYIGTCTSFTP